MIILEARLLWNLFEGGTALYGPFRFLRPQRVWFSAAIDRVQSSIDKSRTKAKIEREKALGTRLGVSHIPNAVCRFELKCINDNRS